MEILDLIDPDGTLQATSLRSSHALHTPREYLVLFLCLAVTLGAKGQDKKATPAEQYKALRKEYDRASPAAAP